MHQKLAEKIYSMTLLISRLALLNLFAFLFILLGAGIFGFLPSVVSVVNATKKIHQQNDDQWLRRMIIDYFFFLKKLLPISILLALVSLLLILSYFTLGQQVLFFKQFIIVLLVYIYGLVVPNFAMNILYFQINYLAALKNSLLLPLLWGFTSLKMMLVYASIICLSYFLPGLLLFFALSVPIYLISYLLLTRWNKQMESLNTERGSKHA